MNGLADKLTLEEANNRHPEIIYKDSAFIKECPTSHGKGLKKVLLNAAETKSCVTQISLTSLNKGDIVETHLHPTMDEHFLFMSGECIVETPSMKYYCHRGVYLLIPAGVPHKISAVSDTEMTTIGIAI